MQVAPNVYRLNIPENPQDGGAMHPGGTNIYFVGDPADKMVLIDTGEPYREWMRQILEFYVELGSPPISAILVTHGHGDHIGGLERLQEQLSSERAGQLDNQESESTTGSGCPVRCHPRLAKRLGRMLGSEAVVPLRSRELIPTGGGATLRALFTPGHEQGHVCYYLPRQRVMFTGDTILGASSSTVSNLSDYMRSLEVLARYRPRMICPGHGPVVGEGAARIRTYIDHRQRRERQVLEALEKGYTDVDEIVGYVYTRNLRKGLRHAAAQNVLAHLAKLKQECRVAEAPASYSLRES